MYISVKAGHGDPCGSKTKKVIGVIGVLKTTEVPQNGHVEIRASPPQKGAGISPAEVHPH